MYHLGFSTQHTTDTQKPDRTQATDESDKKNGLRKAKIALKQGQFDRVLSLLEPILFDFPRDEQALYILAVCQRYQGQPQAAKKTLLELQHTHPLFSCGFQEAGHLYLQERQLLKAQQAYRRAVDQNDALLSSWQGLETIAKAHGNTHLIQEVTRHIERLQALPETLRSVCSLINEGKLLKAEALCRQFLAKNPTHLAGIHLLAQIGHKNQAFDDVEHLLSKALEAIPDSLELKIAYIQTLYQQQKYEDAFHIAEQLYLNRSLCAASPPENTRRNSTLKNILQISLCFANQCAALGHYRRAIAIFDDVLQLAPQYAIAHLLRGHSLQVLRETDLAIDAYRNAYKSQKDFGDAYWSLANLKIYRFNSTEIEAMKYFEQDSMTSLDDRIHLCFSLGKSNEDQRNYKQAMDFYHRGNTLKNQQLKQQGNAFSNTSNRIRHQLYQRMFTRDLLSRRIDEGCQSPDPIFIVGLPRSGSTLIEQILASHSQVDGTFELHNIPSLAHRLRRKSQQEQREKNQSSCAGDVFAEKIAAYSPDEWRILGEEYINNTRPHRQDAPFFVDKMPNNFAHIGLIHKILPNAKIIDIRRHPLASCFSVFKQYFATGHEFSYSLNDIAHYYLDYYKLMNYWDKVLPGKVLHIQYEEVVSDLTTQVRHLLQHCELAFEPDCIDFYRTNRRIKTPSAEQVTQPIYHSAVDHWRNFEGYLDEPKSILDEILPSL